MTTGGKRGGRRPGAGRPRLKADAIILSATRSVMRDVGFARLSVDAVADEAGVSVGTIYRRWPTKTALAVAAFSDTIGSPTPADTGSLHSDLDVLVTDLYRFFTGEHGELMALLIRGAGEDSAAIAAVKRSTRIRRAGLRLVLERAAGRGELSTLVDLEIAMDLMVGPMWTRLLVTGRPITRPVIRSALETVLAGIAAVE